MLYHTLDALQIPADCFWTDEYAWTPVEQSSTRSLTGARIVQVGLKIKGRPITLESAEQGGWVPKSTVDTLHAQRANATATYTLTLADGRVFTVAHDPERDFTATPVIRPVIDPTATTLYRITLPLIEV